MGRLAPFVFTLAALLAGPWAGGCSVERNLFLAGVPGVETDFRVRSVAERHGFLDVRLTGAGHDTELRTFLPDSAACREVLRAGGGAEGRVAFVSSGPAGRLEAGGAEGAECRAAGIGSLADWRARRPETEGLGATPVPREQATWEVAHRDEATIWLRGQFPLASRVGWPELGDTLAVVPNDGVCPEVAVSGVGSLQYYPTGRPVLALVGPGDACPIVGLVRPDGPG